MLTALLALAACSHAPGATAFIPADGHWWLAASSGQRDGFDIGFDTCDGDMLHHVGPALSRSAFDRAITTYYQQHTGDAALPVTVVVSRLDRQWQITRAYQFLAIPAENVYQGEIWRQSTTANQDGITRGFLSCQAAEQGARVMVPVPEIVRRVSLWYGTEIPNQGDTINPAHANDILYKVILRAERKSQGGKAGFEGPD